ncbi:Crp/Fnr family transcriptional regulator [Variovorax sp. KK3]|uniref:Crp/Fnr family transcriptional regulator n=1 Tax=Variovorax sp. KK3 TaxID=1855728 RepID=UPI00097CB69E|nr:Crp/Fnr family transcriptional regulator [Variovorax sp. KK3]
MTRPQRTTAASLTLDELLDQSEWFIRLDEDARRQVRADISERAVAQGASLGSFGEHQRAWFGVLEGLVKWAITARDGRAVTLGGQSVGSWFGEGTLIRATPRQSDLVALRHSRVAMLPLDTFDWLRRNRPAFNDFLLQQVNERLHWFMGNFAAQGLLDIDAQVARALVGMVNPLLNPRGERHLQLSQEELANLAAVSRQSCNAALKRLKDAGVVRGEYGGIEVIDLAALQRLAE